MHQTPSVFIATQAASEYVAITRRATSAPGNELQLILDGARDYFSEHTLAVVLGAVAVFVMFRFVFSPRVH